MTTLPLKRFLYDEAERTGLTTRTVFTHVYNGTYRGKIKLKRKNARVVLVIKLDV